MLVRDVQATSQTSLEANRAEDSEGSVEPAVEVLGRAAEVQKMPTTAGETGDKMEVLTVRGDITVGRNLSKHILVEGPRRAGATLATFLPCNNQGRSAHLPRGAVDQSASSSVMCTFDIQRFVASVAVYTPSNAPSKPSCPWPSISNQYWICEDDIWE